jgi:hypothetical protein
MSTATEAVIVTKSAGTIRVKFENLEPACAVRGWFFTGKVKRAVRLPIKPEIDGAPFVTGLNGPMFEAPGVVRYEET